MSCYENNPCSDPCNQTNPCYEDCGCLHPTTFACITLPGTLSNLEITNDMTGAQVLTQIDTKYADLEDQIAAIVVPEQNTGDTHVKITSNDTTTGYLNDKIEAGTGISKTILNPSGVEKLRLNVVSSQLISGDLDNLLSAGTDGKLLVTVPQVLGSETIIVEGAGMTVTGIGTSDDPYVISTNPSITALRPCFSGTWQSVTLTPSTNAKVTVISGDPKYRIRHDGTIEFKGSLTVTVDFGAYTSGDRKQLLTMGNLATSCLTSTEQAGIADLKSIMYIDTPQASADQIVQQYGYIIRKSGVNIILEFQSSFTNATSKTIVVNFDGSVSHPAI